MVDAGYNYDRLAEKMGWLGIDPKSIHHIPVSYTHLCEPGRAVCTPAFGLPAKYIFHAVCPAWQGGCGRLAV